MLRTCVVCRPSFDQILEELKRMNSNWRTQCDRSDASTGPHHLVRLNSTSVCSDSLVPPAKTDGTPASKCLPGIGMPQHKGVVVQGAASPQQHSPFRHPQTQPGQHLKRQPGPLAPVHPCLTDRSRDALVLLSDCGSTCATLTTQ